MSDKNKLRTPIRRKNAQQRREKAQGSKEKFGVLLATSNEILREGLRSMIAHCGFRIFDCQVTDRGFVLDDLTVQRCQIFVITGSEDIDYSLTKQFVAQIRERNEHGHIVVLIPPHLANAFDPAIFVNASVIVTTDVTAYMLVNLLRLVSQNYVIRSAHVAIEPNPGKAKNMDGAVPTLRAEPLPVIDDKTFAGLSSRESEILLHVTRGSSNKVIARALGIAEATVKIHVKGIFRKIGVVNRTQAAFYVFNHGWLNSDGVSLQNGASLQDAVIQSSQKTNCFPSGMDIIVPRNVLR